MSGERFPNNFEPKMRWAAFLSIALVETVLLVKLFTFNGEKAPSITVSGKKVGRA